MSSTANVNPASVLSGTSEEIDRALYASLERQRSAMQAEPYPDARVREDRVRRALNAILVNEKRIIEATQEDFGKRPELTVLQADLMFPIGGLRHALRHVARWMRPEKRKPDFPFNLLGARTYIYYQPLGVVGVMSPWNLPFGLAYAPLAGILAAGNRAMIKPSELTPHTSAIVAEITAKAFAPEEVTVVQGGVDVASRFAALPFDHLIFTGGAPIARHVMRAAADRLTPVTLELGGKGPVIIARGGDLEAVAAKVVAVKLANAGQACIGIDHIRVHRSDRDAFVAAVKRKMAEFYPNFAGNPDVCHVFLEKQRRHLARLVEDADRRGVQVDILGGGDIARLADDPNFPLVLLIDPPADSEAMQVEIFGPVLPIVSYDTLEEAAQQIRSGERPLALYFFGGSKQEQEYILRNTWAGGVTFDDVMLHALMQDLPFGGVGESGMGRYGGHAGFKTFSNGKSVAHPPRLNLMKMNPPYTAKMSATMRSLLGKP